MAQRTLTEKFLSADSVITSSGQTGIVIGGAGARDVIIRLPNGQLIAHSTESLRIEEPASLSKEDPPDEERETRMIPNE